MKDKAEGPLKDGWEGRQGGIDRAIHTLYFV